MPNYVLSRNERVYIAKQPTFGTAVSPTATDAVRHIRCKLKPMVSTLRRRDKTGTRSQIAGKKGRQHGMWSIEGSLVHGADADDLPDYDALYEAAFGAAGVVTATEKVTYTLSDVIKYFTMWQYVGDGTGTPNHQYGHSAVVRRMVFNIGQDVAEFSAEGECAWVQGSKSFAGASLQEKAGLGAFPAEPVSQTCIGNLIEGFVGAITVGGSTIADLVSATITVDFANEVVKNTFGRRTPSGSEGDVRSVTVALSVHNSDDAALETLREASESKAQLDATFTVGEDAGHIYDFDLKAIQLEVPDYDDGARRTVLNFPEALAVGTPGSKDEFKMTLR